MQTVIIDDSNIISHMIKSALTPYGYSIDHFKSKDYAPYKFPFNRYQLFIVNKSISSFEGLSVVEEVRRRCKEALLIAIMTKGDWREKVKYLQAGADEVLNYPFPMQELVARVENLSPSRTRRRKIKFEIGDVTLDPEIRSVLLRDKPVHLRKKEYGILEYLARNKDRAVSRSELLDNLWDYRKITGSNTVDVHISNIRKKLEGEDVIKTVHGFGYKITQPKDNKSD